MTLHLSDPGPGAAPSCGTCRHFKRRAPDERRRIPGVVVWHGHCGLRDPGKRGGPTMFCRETDWCDRHAPAKEEAKP